MSKIYEKIKSSCNNALQKIKEYDKRLDEKDEVIDNLIDDLQDLRE